VTGSGSIDQRCRSAPSTLTVFIRPQPR